jgi:DNA helicase II / ATP-dependent DNA helicase PcrA
VNKDIVPVTNHQSPTPSLNPEQQKAVEHTEGPLLILAGAGSGKTRVIVHRIVHLVSECDVRPEQILAVTFTNKAAQEMKDRIARILPQSVSSLWISTFHSACVRMIRANAERIGLKKKFVIYDTTDQKTLAVECLKELKMDPKSFKPSSVLGHIDDAKNHLVTAECYADTASNFYEKKIADFYLLFQKKLRENNALDFGDLLMESVFLLQQSPNVLEYYQQRFQYILIDEYQDTNTAQYQWVRLLAQKHRNLCVVGDDDQSIYRWRGADIQNILNFENDYRGATVIKLEQNYRSTGNILEMASNVIANNAGRKPKTLWTEQAAGDRATWYLAQDDRGEAGFTAESIQMAIDNGARLSDMAVFYRTNAQSRQFEDQLRRHGIPYVIFGGMRFYDRKEIRDLLAYLRVLLNPDDDISFKRIFNVPTRGLGAKALEFLEDRARDTSQSLVATLINCVDDPQLSQAMGRRLKVLASLMKSLAALARELPIGNLTEAILDQSGYREDLKNQKSAEAEERLENIEEFLNSIAEYERNNEDTSLAGFLEEVALVGQTDNYDPALGTLSMMTLHLAKGLEFDYVYMAGMEESLFPHARSMDDPLELEEERRLCYVGITRARKKVTFSSVLRRRIYGGDRMNMPSRFLDEIPQDLLERHGAAETASFSPKNEDHFSMEWETPSPFFRSSVVDETDFDFDQRPPEELGMLNAGVQVKHPQFGPGVVRKTEGRGDQQKVTVSFSDGRTKTLLVKYAHLAVAS